MLVSTTICSYPMVSSVSCEDKLCYVVLAVSSGEIVAIDTTLVEFKGNRVLIRTVVLHMSTCTVVCIKVL